MKTNLTLRKLFRIVATGLGCTLVILSMAMPVAADGGGTPTVDGRYTGDEANYKVLGSADGGRGTLYYNRVGNTLYLLVRVDPKVNDNVFGDHKIDEDYLISADWKTGGGAKNHGFGALLNSDNTEFRLTCGGKSWSWAQGYLYKDGDEWKSDYLDADGGGLPPSPWVSHSSLEWNLENTSWDVTLAAYGVSPPRDQALWISPGVPTNAPTAVPGSYSGFDSTYNWEWAMVYETSVDVSACGDNDITVSVPSAHNSPPKSGDENVPICYPTPCSLPASIGDYVWYDVNMNGLQDAGESGLDGVTVNLYDSSHNPKGTTTTSGGGLYTFTNLAPGDYYVEFVLPEDYDFSLQDQVGVGDDTDDSDANPTTGQTVVTTLLAGETDLTWDAGLHLCTIGDRVWKDDTDPEGEQNADLWFGIPEEGFNDVRVCLYSNSDNDANFEPGGDDPLEHCTYTTSGTSQEPDGWPDGIYGFDMPSLELGPGQYWVWVDEDTLPPLPFPEQWVSTTGGDYQLVNYAGGDDFSLDFGYKSVISSSSVGRIGDRVWNDEDGLGDQTKITGPFPYEEPGLDGVNVYLYWDNGDDVFDRSTDTQVGSADTTEPGTSEDPDDRSNGIYGFDVSYHGTYWVWVDEDTLPGQGVTTNWTSTTNNNPEKVVYAGTSDLSIDFGYEAEAIYTAVTLSSFAAKSSAGGSASPVWLGLAGVTILAAGSLFWRKRRTS